MAFSAITSNKTFSEYKFVKVFYLGTISINPWKTLDYPVKSEPDCIVFFAAVLYGLNEYVNSYVCVENENFISGCKK